MTTGTLIYLDLPRSSSKVEVIRQCARPQEKDAPVWLKHDDESEIGNKSRYRPSVGETQKYI